MGSAARPGERFGPGARPGCRSSPNRAPAAEPGTQGSPRQHLRGSPSAAPVHRDRPRPRGPRLNSEAPPRPPASRLAGRRSTQHGATRAARPSGELLTRNPESTIVVQGRRAPEGSPQLPSNRPVGPRARSSLPILARARPSSTVERPRSVRGHEIPCSFGRTARPARGVPAAPARARKTRRSPSRSAARCPIRRDTWRLSGSEIASRPSLKQVFPTL